MTKTFQRKASCPNCGERIPLEDNFSQWIRGHQQLRSGDGFAFMDKDLVCHRFKTSFGRDFQCLMFVEVKTLGAQLSDVQRDTMHIVNQIFRNRRGTPTKKQLQQVGGLPHSVYSVMARRNVEFKALGYHLLKLDGNTPEDSSDIQWDKHFITKEALIDLLRFELDPDTLEKMNWRKHHAPKAMELFTLRAA